MTAEPKDERAIAYEESIERLTAAIVKLRSEQKRMKWVLLATLVATPLAFLWNVTAGILVGIGGLSMFGVGHYVVYMHIQEDKLTIANAKRRIAALRSGRG